MNLDQRILQVIIERPGTRRDALTRMFELSDYRLNRIFRHIERELDGKRLISHDDNGVWIVAVRETSCMGVEWVGHNSGGYVQCNKSPEFPDGRCYTHSTWESGEMVGFQRLLAYLAGPADPTPYTLSQLALHEVEDLIELLTHIKPATRLDAENKLRLLKTLRAARRVLAWKDQMRQRRSEGWIPPEFQARHRASSINTFEYSLKKHFILLEVPTDSTREQVLKAWKRLARRFHPDVEGGGDEERMKAINEAKEKIFKIRRWD